MADSTETRRLLLQVDAAVTLAQQNLKSLARSVDTESTNIDRSLQRVNNAHKNMTEQFGNSRIALLEVQHVARGAADQFAAGTPLIQIFSQHIAQLSQAASFAGEGLGKFGTFLAGPWGVALTLATVVLTKLISAHGDAEKSVDDLVKHMQDQAQQAIKNEQANNIWAHSLDGVRESQKKLREEIEKSFSTEAYDQQRKLNQAKQGLDTQTKALPSAEAAVPAAQAAVTAQQRLISNIGNPGTESGQAALAAQQVILGNLQQKLVEARAALKQLRADIANSETTIRAAQTQIATRQAEYTANHGKELSDFIGLQRLRVQNAAEADNKIASSSKSALTAIALLESAQNDATSAGGAAEKQAVSQKQRILDLTSAFVKGKIGPEEFAKSLGVMTTALVKATAAEKEHAKSSNENRQFGRQVSFAEATSIAKAAGFQVNSGYRSPAEQARLFNDPNVNRPGNPVAAPGSSAHNGANGKWAIDIQITDGVTPGKIRKVFADQGISLTKVLKEQGHFHVEGSRSEAAHEENAAAAAAKKTQHNNDAFTQDLDRSTQELLAAQKEQLGDYRAQAGYARDIVEQEKKRAEDAIAAKVADQTYTVKQGEALTLVQEQLADQRLKNIAIKEQVHNLQQEDDLQSQAAGFREEDLRAQDASVKTQAEHRKIQLEIIDILYQEKLAHLESLKAQADLAKNTEEAAKIQAQIDHLPAEKAHATADVNHQTQGPLASFLDNIPHTTDQINEAMQNLEVQGINGVADSLVALTGGFSNFRQVALSAIKDILAQLIRLQIMKAIFNIAGGAGGGGWQTGVISGGGSLAGLSPAMGLASGGLVSGSGTATSDSIPAMLSNGEFVVNAAAVNRLGLPFFDALNSGSVSKADIANAGGGGGGGGFGIGSLSGIGLAQSAGFKIRSPLSFGLVGQLLHLRDGGPVSGVSIPRPSRVRLPTAANSNGRGGDVHVHTQFNNYAKMTDREARMTAMQHATQLRASLNKNSGHGF
jgi:hypothetical protein